MKALAREWSPLSLALSCVLASIALCLHADNILMFAFEKSGAAGLFAGSFLVGVVALCAAVLVSAHDDERRLWSIGVGLAAASAGVAVPLLFLDVLPTEAVAVASGAPLGFGLTCLLRQWGRHYRSFSFPGALLNTALAFLLASCWWFIMMHAGSPFLFCLGQLVLVLSGSLPLLASDIVRADEVRAGLRAADSWVPSVTIWQVMRQGWAAVVGLMFNFFMLGLTFWPLAAGLGSGAAFKPLPYALVAAAAWLVAVRAHGEDVGMLETFYRAALPAAAVLMLAVPLLAGALPGVPAAARSLVSYAGVAALNVLGLVILFWSAKSSEVGFSKMFAAFCATCAASMAVGLALFLAMGMEARPVALALLAAYAVALVAGEVWIALGRRRARVACAEDADAACAAGAEGAEDGELDVVGGRD